MTDTYSVAEIVKRTGALRRRVQLWADAGVIRSSAATQHGGSGTHRAFDGTELQIAALVTPLANLSMSIGLLKFFADEIRPILCGNFLRRKWPHMQPDEAKTFAEAFDRARRNEGANVLTFTQTGDRFWFGVCTPDARGNLIINARIRDHQNDQVQKGRPMILLDLNDLLGGLLD